MPVQEQQQQQQSTILGPQIKMGSETGASGGGAGASAKQKPKRCEIICYYFLLQHSLISYI